MKRAIIIASVASMIDQFNLENIKLLRYNNYHVDVACNFEKGSTCSDEVVASLKKILYDLNVHCYQIDFSRSIYNFRSNIKAYKQIRALSFSNKYDIVHCHSPIGGLIARVVFNKYRKKGTYVIYTAHGFHFYKGAPIKNWALFYTVEKLLSNFTDALITINNEDYNLANERMKAKNVFLLPGVGIDISKFDGVYVNSDIKRGELGIPQRAYLILSVGELNDNKNHEAVIKALASLNDKEIHYIIAGQGDKYNYLEKLSDELGVSDRVHLLGFRRDVIELYKISDLYIHPSIREGLPVALMEAIAAKCPVTCSRIRGNIDLVREEYCFDPNNTNEIVERINYFKKSNIKDLVDYNYMNLRSFDVKCVLDKTAEIYSLKIGEDVNNEKTLV